MKKTKSEPIYIAESKFGRGVFASRDIRKGEVICTMKGKRITAEQLNLITKKGRDLLVDPLQIDEHIYLDLDIPYLYLNHSCEPNAGLKNGIELTAIKYISKDNEIFYDYSTVWLEGFICKCESKKCRKHISDFYTIPAETRRKYAEFDIIPDFIKKIVDG